MPARLHQTWISALAGLPETGMGYQVVSLPDLGPRTLAIIGGAKELLELPHLRTRVFERGDQGTAEDVVRLLGEPKGTAPVRVLSRSEAQAAGAIEAKAILGSGPASAAPVELSDLEEKFLRFSAYANDIRILADGSVTAGTYVTTYDDGILVKTGIEAVSRYALPNPAPAIHRFYLRPPGKVDVRRGTTQPAFGQPGGGVEVIFVTGAPPKTKYQEDTIPPK